MIKPDSPKQLAEDLLSRSICKVQVAAVVADRQGIFSWGWNSVGSGFGEHAEAAAIRRANKSRLFGAKIYVCGKWKHKDKAVPSAPCPECMKLILKYNLTIFYRDGHGSWL